MPVHWPPPEVLGAWEITVEGVIPVSDVFKLETPHGAYCLKPSTLSGAKLWALDEAMGLLIKHGFLQVAPLVPSRDGAPFAAADGVCYYLTEWFEGEQPDVKRTGRATAVSRVLAEFHRAAYGLSLTQDLRSELGKWPERFQARRDELAAFRDEAAARSEGVDRLDQVWLKSADSLLEAADRSLGLLDPADYLTICEEAAREGRFCHGDVASRNFLEVGGTYFMIDFDSFLVEIQLFDLGRLIRRTMKHCRWNADLAKQMVGAYADVKPLSTAERRILAAMVWFPQKYWRLLHRHYRDGVEEKRKPSAATEKLEGLVGQLPAFLRCAEALEAWLTKGPRA